MKHPFLLTCIVALALPTLAAADVSPMAKHFLDRFDADADGAVSLAELAKSRTKVFLEYDEDNDRVLTEAEFANLAAAQAAHRALPDVIALGEKPARIHAILSLEESDLDHDGKVTKAEYQGNSALWFKNVDKNDDGLMSVDELDAW